LSTKPLSDFEKIHFFIQTTLGIDIIDSFAIFNSLFQLYNFYNPDNQYKSRFQKIIENYNHFVEILSAKYKLQDDVTPLIKGYLFLFLYSFFFLPTESDSRKYNNLIVIRHNFQDLKSVLSHHSIQMIHQIFRDLNNDELLQYYDTIHFEEKTPEKATEYQKNPHIHLFPFDSDSKKIFIEFRGLPTLLRSLMNGKRTTLENCLDYLS
jgi:hypothetical protein